MATAMLTSLPKYFEYRLDLARFVTPRMLMDQPVHRWFYFPHSFSPQLVEMLLLEWQVEPGSVIIDPFVGAGTTMRAAQKMGIDCIGADLSPLSVLVSNVKVGRYEIGCVEDALNSIHRSQQPSIEVDISRNHRLQRAFTSGEFAQLVTLRQAIMQQSECVRDLFLVGLLRTQQSISRAVPDGGWFRWIERDPLDSEVWQRFEVQMRRILDDIRRSKPPADGTWHAHIHDARDLLGLRARQPALHSGCQALITSPPYPNRHDYSRVFQIELLTLGLQEEDVFELRHNSLRSHVEARAPKGSEYPFVMPVALVDVLDSLPEEVDKRIAPMLQGYFEDMSVVLHSAYELLSPGGKLALVVGNVRHAGVMVPVDEILMELGKSIGYVPEMAWVARLRGNSAQQMGKFGRAPARESIVILQRP